MYKVYSVRVQSLCPIFALPNPFSLEKKLCLNKVNRHTCLGIQCGIQTNLFGQNLDPSTPPPARGGAVIIWIPLSLPPVTEFSFLLNQLWFYSEVVINAMDAQGWKFSLHTSFFHVARRSCCKEILPLLRPSYHATCKKNTGKANTSR